MAKTYCTNTFATPPPIDLQHSTKLKHYPQRQEGIASPELLHGVIDESRLQTEYFTKLIDASVQILDDQTELT